MTTTWHRDDSALRTVSSEHLRGVLAQHRARADQDDCIRGAIQCIEGELMRRDIDDTARLILMGQPNIPLIALTKALRAEGHRVGYAEMTILWGKYRGFDGRTCPTHDVHTGERIA